MLRVAQRVQPIAERLDADEHQRAHRRNVQRAAERGAHADETFEVSVVVLRNVRRRSPCRDAPANRRATKPPSDSDARAPARTGMASASSRPAGAPARHRPARARERGPAEPTYASTRRSRCRPRAPRRRARCASASVAELPRAARRARSLHVAHRASFARVGPADLSKRARQLRRELRHGECCDAVRRATARRLSISSQSSPTRAMRARAQARAATRVRAARSGCGSNAASTQASGSVSPDGALPASRCAAAPIPAARRGSRAGSDRLRESAAWSSAIRARAPARICTRFCDQPRPSAARVRPRSQQRRQLHRDRAGAATSPRSAAVAHRTERRCASRCRDAVESPSSPRTTAPTQRRAKPRRAVAHSKRRTLHSRSRVVSSTLAVAIEQVSVRRREPRARTAENVRSRCAGHASAITATAASARRRRSTHARVGSRLRLHDDRRVRRLAEHLRRIHRLHSRRRQLERAGVVEAQRVFDDPAPFGTNR